MSSFWPQPNAAHAKRRINLNTCFINLTPSGSNLATPWLIAETRVHSQAQCMWDLWEGKWHWDTFFPKYFSFSLSVPFHQHIRHRRYLIFAVDSVGKQSTCHHAYLKYVLQIGWNVTRVVALKYAEVWALLDIWQTAVGLIRRFNKTGNARGT